MDETPARINGKVSRLCDQATVESPEENVVTQYQPTIFDALADTGAQTGSERRDTGDLLSTRPQKGWNYVRKGKIQTKERPYSKDANARKQEDRMAELRHDAAARPREIRLIRQTTGGLAFDVPPPVSTRNAGRMFSIRDAIEARRQKVAKKRAETREEFDIMLETAEKRRKTCTGNRLCVKKTPKRPSPVYYNQEMTPIETEALKRHRKLHPQTDFQLFSFSPSPKPVHDTIRGWGLGGVADNVTAEPAPRSTNSPRVTCHTGAPPNDTKEHYRRASRDHVSPLRARDTCSPTRSAFRNWRQKNDALGNSSPSSPPSSVGEFDYESDFEDNGDDFGDA